jgi:hypothetical protein
MRLDWVIPCTAVVFHENGGVTIEGAGFDCLQVDALPQRITLTVLLRVAGLPDDFTEDASRTIEVYMTGPGMENLAALDFEVSAGEPGPDSKPGWELWQFVPLAIAVTVQREGAHMIDVYLATDRPERLVDPSRRRSIPLQIELGQISN